MKAFRMALMLAFAAVSLVLACDTGTDPDEANASNVCERDLCGTSSLLASECQEFLDNCLLVEDEDECVGGALLICSV